MSFAFLQWLFAFMLQASLLGLNMYAVSRCPPERQHLRGSVLHPATTIDLLAAAGGYAAHMLIGFRSRLHQSI